MTESSSSNSSSGSSRDLESTIQEIADRYLDALERGIDVDRARFLEEHADLGEELGRRLALVEALYGIGLGGDSGGDDERPTRDARPGSGSPAPGGADVDDDDADLPVAGSTLGRFELLEVVGRGGFGVVYRARDPRMAREVALKVPRNSRLLSRTERERFLREARNAARLHVDGILQVHEVGEADGWPFLVTEYLSGGTLAEKMASGRLDSRLAVEQIVRIAGALDAAHREGIVHRDVKPGNVLLDRRGQAWLTDFGLARHLETDQTVTRDGHALGTPAYMSPEMASARHDEVGPLSDVYSLGVMLYELLGSQTPFLGTRDMLVYQLLHEEPRPLRSLDHRIPQDLDTICLKALQKEPARRYASAAEFADDLQRFLRGEPIHARPVSGRERLWRWCRRNPLPAVLAGSLFLVLIATAVAASVAALTIHRARTDLELANLASHERLWQLNVLQGVHGLGGQPRADAVDALPWLVEALKSLPESAPEARVQRQRLGLILRSCPELIQLWSHEGRLLCGDLHPDGKSVAVGGERGAWIHFLDGSSSRELLPAGAYHAIRFSRSGDRVLGVAGKKVVGVWDASSGALLRKIVQGSSVLAVVPSPDGKHLFTTSTDGRVRSWHLKSADACGWYRHGAHLNHVAFDSAGTRMISSGSDGRAILWALAERRQLSEFGHSAGIWEATIFAGGARVATAGQDFRARLWDGNTGQQVGTDLTHGMGVIRLAVDSGEKLLATSSWEGTVKVWSTADGKPIGPGLDHSFPVHCLDFSPCGRYIASGSDDGKVRIWRTTTGVEFRLPLVHAGRVRTVKFLDDGHRVFTVSSDGTARVWDIAYEPASVPVEVEPYDPLVAESPDGRWKVAPGDDRQTLVLADLRTGEEVARPALSKPLHVVRFSPIGDNLATGGDDGRAVIWSWKGGTAAAVEVFSHPAFVKDLAFSPDASLLATACDDGGVRLWERGNSGAPRFVARNARRVNCVVFNADGSRILSGGFDHVAQIWDAGTGSLVANTMRTEDAIFGLAWSADDSLVAAFERGGILRLWDGYQGQPMTAGLVVDRPSWNDPIEVLLSPDGASLSSTSTVGFSQTWELVPTTASIEELESRTAIHSGHRLDSRGTRTPLVGRELEEAFRISRSFAPTDLATDAGAVRRWRELELIRCRTDGDRDAYLWHLGRLVQEDPGDLELTLRLARARLKGLQGSFEQALDRLAPRGR